MKLLLENVDLASNSGPNSFAKKLITKLPEHGVEFVNDGPDISLCFIQSNKHEIPYPRVLRLDGIYYNLAQDYKSLNANIEKTYKQSSGIIFQSEFSI